MSEGESKIVKMAPGAEEVGFSKISNDLWEFRARTWSAISFVSNRQSQDFTFNFDFTFNLTSLLK